MTRCIYIHTQKWLISNRQSIICTNLRKKILRLLHILFNYKSDNSSFLFKLTGFYKCIAISWEDDNFDFKKSCCISLSAQLIR